ncbi:hypothetical protein OEZ85_013237 [Tetradesmus obliquus]|uniref:Nucleotide exchange factor Fes1 domain-containing protein n=1 Tax=Tetradesmus obliquus TaxID=3088 RepID=A0ABY8U545_TETOB|nr:hypothetical protein OEZ85_013237 [Tetradesmus obliquus]
MSTPEDKPELEEEQEHTEDDHTEDEETSSEADHQDGGAKKKKKKRKKKKKAGSGAAGAISSSDEGQAVHDKVDKQEAERRFQKALESAKHDEDMWVLLANANVHDAKARKLFEALKSNSSITSVNLSANYIGDEGVQALVDVLQEGGAPELINLDLRDNTLSDHAQQLLTDLNKRRKQLVIETGPLPDESAAAAAASSSKPGTPAKGRGRAAHQQQQQQQQQEEQQDNQQWDGQSLKDLVKHSAMFRRYFQTEEEEAGGAGSSGEDEADAADDLPPPEEVWGQVSELLPGGRSSIPALAEALLVVSRALDAEMGSMPSVEDKAGLQDFRPHFRAVLEHLGLLQQVLQLQPEPQLTQSSSKAPQPAVGSHRVWACAILHMLLLHNNPVIDKAVCDAQLLPVAVALSLQHERCSAVQCRAAEMLRSSLLSSVPQLWQGLFTAGLGCGLQQAGSEQLLQPLHEALVQIADEAEKQEMGKRSAVVGFVSEVANTLLQAADPVNQDLHCAALAAVLQDSDAWQGSIQQQGSIHSLLQEQDGQLCGPPPPRPAASENEEDATEQSQFLNGTQLMALLSRMSAS